MLIVCLCTVILTVIFLYAYLFLRGLNLVLDIFLIGFPFFIALGTLLFVSVAEIL